MNEKQIRTSIGKVGERKVENSFTSRTLASVKKAVRSKKVSMGEPIFKIMSGGFYRTCFKRWCKRCGNDIFMEIAAILRGRKGFCSIACGLQQYGETNGGERHHNYVGGDAPRRRRYLKKHPEKEACRRITRYLINTGKLQRKPCEVCGNIKSESHHKDYSQPEAVTWLCRSHHLAAHCINGGKCVAIC